MKDLHILPKIRDAWSFLYLEHCKIDREENAILFHDERGRVPVPCASLSVLLLGPGTSVTHAAISVLAENGCLVLWVGESGVRFYAEGMGETRSSSPLLQQARLWADPASHLGVVMRMYRIRFPEQLPPGLSLQQIRGLEGIRVRQAYAQASAKYGVKWSGRNYDRRSWERGDPINRALSAANSALYGICHAAIISAGLSPSLGFVHTGKRLSFVYDVADLYKTETSLPAAFEETAKGPAKLESRVRKRLRDLFTESKLLDKVVPDLQRLLDIRSADSEADDDAALPGGLWDPSGASVQGGANFADVGEPDKDDSIDPRESFR